jgi:hypothetical protein
MALGLDSFVRYLRWRETEPACPLEWKRDYLASLQHKAGPVLVTNPALAEALRKMSPDQLESVFFSPHVIWALKERPDLEEAGRWLTREVAAVVGGHPAQESINFVDGMRIDYESSFSLPGDLMATLGPTPHYFRRAERDRIAAACSVLRREAAAAFEFVKALTLRIAIRSRLDKPFWHLSGSLTEYPGLTLAVNPWSARFDSAQVIENLVHENIHHAISLYEPLRHDLTEGLPPGRTLRSFWTGNELPAHTFVEACFVWWGLYNLWSSWPADSEIPASRIAAHREKARKGFESRPGHSLITAVGVSQLPGNTVAALLRIDEEALQALSNAA